MTVSNEMFNSAMLVATKLSKISNTLFKIIIEGEEQLDDDIESMKASMQANQELLKDLQRINERYLEVD